MGPVYAGSRTVRIDLGWHADVLPLTWHNSYLDAAIDWARQTGLKVVIDLHGVPKSQNGFDHSGHKGDHVWGDADSLAYTHTALRVLEERYAIPSMQDVVVAIQPVNEPFLQVLDINMVRQFYRDAFYNLREISDTPVMFHDGFYDPEWMNGFLTPQDNGAQGVIVDHHQYQIFDSGLISMSVDQHVNLACEDVKRWAVSDKWTGQYYLTSRLTRF
jgi:glucan 1,3-beta-glucosidase